LSGSTAMAYWKSVSLSRQAGLYAQVRAASRAPSAAISAVRGAAGSRVRHQATTPQMPRLGREARRSPETGRSGKAGLAGGEIGGERKGREKPESEEGETPIEPAADHDREPERRDQRQVGERLRRQRRLAHARRPERVVRAQPQRDEHRRQIAAEQDDGAHE